MKLRVKKLLIREWLGKLFKARFQREYMINEKTTEITKAKLAKPSWIKMKSAELEKIIIDLAKKGETPAGIGLILRDKYGVPKAKLLGKRVCQILDEKEIDYQVEVKIVQDRVDNLKKHLASNKHDHPASRALTKKLWVIHKAGIN